MKRMKTIVAMNMIGFFFMALSMDEPSSGRSGKRSGRPRAARTHSDGGGDVAIEMSEMGDPKKKKVAPLDLVSVSASEQHMRATTVGGTSRHAGPRTPVGNFQGLQEQVKRTQSTYRELQKAKSIKRSRALDRPEKRKFHMDDKSKSTEEQLLETIVQDNPRIIDERKVQRIEELLGVTIVDGKKYYSEDDVWEKIAVLNPTLHMIAQKDNMDLDAIMEFAGVVQDVDIGHEVFMQLAQGNLDDVGGQQGSSLWETARNFFIGNPKAKMLPTEFLHHKYEKIRKNSPDKYKELAYEAVKAAYDHTEGRYNRSAIADTHIELQNGKINEQDATIRQQWIGIIVSFLATIASAAWGIYGQTSIPDCPGSGNTSL